MTPIQFRKYGYYSTGNITIIAERVVSWSDQGRSPAYTEIMLDNGETIGVGESGKEVEAKILAAMNKQKGGEK